MTRYVALLRGVSAQTLAMADLRRSLSEAGFDAVQTVLASGNALFDAPPAPPAALEQAVEAALQRAVGRHFHTVVRPLSSLAGLLATDPYAAWALPSDAKRVVSFLRVPRPARVPLPLTDGEATVICQVGAEVFTAYRPGPDGPVFMKLIEQAFGSEVTTRTWDTVARCVAAGGVR